MKLKKLASKLYKGLELDIHVRQDDGSLKFDFRGRLLRKSPAWRDLEPYLYRRVVPEVENVNAVKESWVVEVISDCPFENGKEKVRWIPKLHSLGLIKIRELDENDLHKQDMWYE